MPRLDSARLSADLDDLKPRLEEVARRIHASPELRFEEHKAAAWLAEAVAAEGHAVERGLAGMPTALRARAGSGSGPRVVLCAEYDALPEIGHACGHNLIAAGALGAFLALARQKEALGGTVELLGTPAEEGGGGKIKLLEAGAFEGADAALMFHPFDRDLLAHDTLANDTLELAFRGIASHAALAPWEGSSALTACLDTFRLVDGQRVHFRDGVRVHGIVTEGGVASNIVPERASAVFSVRARTTTELARVRGIVERCARGAALASGAEVEMAWKGGYKNMRSNLPLAERFGEHLRRLGRSPALRDESVGTGSTDMGDVSHALPSIHPWLAIVEPGESTCHQRPFAEAAGSERGMRSMRVAAEAMALLAADVLSDASLREAARASFEAGVS